jgi:hypothetical protein
VCGAARTGSEVKGLVPILCPSLCCSPARCCSRYSFRSLALSLVSLETTTTDDHQTVVNRQTIHQFFSHPHSGTNDYITKRTSNRFCWADLIIILEASLIAESIPRTPLCLIMVLLNTVRSSLYRVGHRQDREPEPQSAQSQESFVIMPLSPLRSSMVGGGTPRHRHTGSKDITDDPFSDPYPARSPRLRHDHAFTHELHYNGAPGPRAGPSSPKSTSSPKSDVFTYGNQEEHLGPSPITNTYPPPSAFGLTEETSHQVPLPRPRPRFSESNPNARKSWYHSIIGAPQARNSRFSIYNPFGGGGAGGFRQSFFHGDDGATGTETSRAVPGHFSRNASERGRLQGLMQWSSTPTKLRLGDGESEVTRETGWIGQNLRRLRIWMVNDG